MFYVYDTDFGIRPREVDFSRHPDPQTREHYRRSPRYLSTRDADPIGIVEQHASEAAAARAVDVLNGHQRKHGRRACYAYVASAALTRAIPPRSRRG